MISWCLVVLYFAIGSWVFFKLRKLQRKILSSKNARRHPDRFTFAVASEIISSVFWPFQIIGVLSLMFVDD